MLDAQVDNLMQVRRAKTPMEGWPLAARVDLAAAASLFSLLRHDDC